MPSAHDVKIIEQNLARRLMHQNYNANVAKLEQLIEDAHVRYNNAQSDAARWHAEARLHQEKGSPVNLANAKATHFLRVAAYYGGWEDGLKRALNVVKGLG